jgi:hypothetical protein
MDRRRVPATSYSYASYFGVIFAVKSPNPDATRVLGFSEISIDLTMMELLHHPLSSFFHSSH